MIAQRRLSVLALMALPLIAACSDVITWASRKDASWEYIQSSTPGITVGPASTSEAGLSFPIHVYDDLHSAGCFSDAKMRLADHRILVSVRSELCSDHPHPPLVASLPKPAPGDYEIAYDDPAAHFPVIGKVHVD